MCLGPEQNSSIQSYAVIASRTCRTPASAQLHFFHILRVQHHCKGLNCSTQLCLAAQSRCCYYRKFAVPKSLTSWLEAGNRRVQKLQKDHHLLQFTQDVTNWFMLKYDPSSIASDGRHLVLHRTNPRPKPLSSKRWIPISNQRTGGEKH